jgi:hypothetical protein
VHETGEICEVVAVNQNFTCDLMLDSDGSAKDTPKFIYNVPFHSLNFLDDFALDDEDYLNCPVDPVGVPPYQKFPSPYLLKGKK